MAPAMDDASLIERCLAGDRGAFEELMRRHEDRVFAVCLRTLRDREAALDATQDTFITVFRKLDRFDGRSAFTTWLHRVAVNTALDRIRHERRRRTTPIDERNDPADPTAHETVEAAGLRPELEAALSSIPEEFASAVVLVDVQGYGTEAAAEILGVARGTVKSRVFRGRRLLAEALGNRNTSSGRPTDTSPT